jgi:hypothetical protein
MAQALERFADGGERVGPLRTSSGERPARVAQAVECLGDIATGSGYSGAVAEVVGEVVAACRRTGAAINIGGLGAAGARSRGTRR